MQITEEITVFAEYVKFINMLWKKLAKIPLEQTNINKYTMKLKDSN